MSAAFELGGGSSFLGALLGYGICYGIHIIIYALFLVVYRYRGKNPFLGVLNISVTCQFILCTAINAVGIADVYLFLTIEFQSERVIDVVGQQLNSTSTVLFATIDFITQAALIYRALIIWERRYLIIILPSVLAIAGFGKLILLFTTTPHNNAYEMFLTATSMAFVGISLNAPDLERALLATNLFLASLCLSMVVNFMVVSIIVTRIWVLSRKFKALHRVDTDNTYNVVISMLLESGAIIFVVQLIVVVLYHTNSPGLPLVQIPSVQIYGLTPTVLLIRVALGSAYSNADPASGPSVPIAFAGRAANHANTGSAASGMLSQTETIGDIEANSGRSNEKSPKALVLEKQESLDEGNNNGLPT